MIRTESLRGCAVACAVAILAGAQPLADAPIPDLRPAAPSAMRSASTLRTAMEVRCLARAIWNEARGEPLRGQIAVAEVVIARSGDRRWHRDLCRTITMPHQFSFVRNGRTEPIPAEDAQRMTGLARAVIEGRLSSGMENPLFFHADYAHPAWRHAAPMLERIGRHLFYGDPNIRTTTASRTT